MPLIVIFFVAAISSSSYRPPRPRSFSEPTSSQVPGANRPRSLRASAQSPLTGTDTRSSSLGSKDILLRQSLSSEKQSGSLRGKDLQRGTSGGHRTPGGQSLNSDKRSGSLGGKDLSYRTPGGQSLGAVKRSSSLGNKDISRRTPGGQSSSSVVKSGRELFGHVKKSSPLQKSRETKKDQDKNESDDLLESQEDEKGPPDGITDFLTLSAGEEEAVGMTIGMTPRDDDITPLVIHMDGGGDISLGKNTGTQPSSYTSAGQANDGEGDGGTVPRLGEERVVSTVSNSCTVHQPLSGDASPSSVSTDVRVPENRQSPQGLATNVGVAVGVAAQERGSGGGGKEKASGKGIGGGLVSERSPDYSHVKSRISTWRSVKTNDLEKAGPAEVIKLLCSTT